jgi:hypothetical protein
MDTDVATCFTFNIIRAKQITRRMELGTTHWPLSLDSALIGSSLLPVIKQSSNQQQYDDMPF